MTDDIVTRLREHHGQFRVAVGVNDAFILETIYEEAADEIERLRAELKRYKDCTESAYWNMRKVLECADNVLPSPHPLWSELNEISESVLWAEKLLDIPIPYEPNHFQKQAVRGE